MNEESIINMYGNIKMRVKLPIYDEWGDPTGTKNVTEDLALIKGGNSDTSKIIINAFTSLYESFELDQDKTTVRYTTTLNEYMAIISEEEMKITTPPNTTWNLMLTTLDQLGNKFERNIGYIIGDISPTKARILDRLARLITNLSTNTYEDTTLEANFKPYKGSG